MSKIENKSNSFYVNENKPTIKKQDINNSNNLENKNTLDINDNAKINNSKVVKDTNISFIDQEINELSNTMNANVNTIIIDFEKKVNDYLKSFSKQIPSSTLKSIYEHNSKLKELVLKGKSNSLSDIKKINDQLLASIRLLNISGIYNNEIKKISNDLFLCLLNKYNKDFGINLQPKVINGVVVGIESKENLSKENKKILKEVNFLFNELESINNLKIPLTYNSIALMGMKQALLKKSMDILSLPDSQNSPLPEVKFKDLEIIANTVKAIDEMLKPTREIPPNLLSDFQKVVDDMLKAPNGMESVLNQNLTSLKSNTKQISNPVKQIDNEIKNITNEAKKNLENIGNEIKNNANTKDIQDLSSEITSTNSIIKEIIKNSPTNLSEEIGKIIDDYTNTMNGIESSLPVLPFPITMPIPLSYNDGSGNSIIIPAGSTITSNSTGFTIDSPGLAMSSGGTLINATNGTIKIGKNDVDRLSFNSLAVSDSTSNSSFTGFDAIINRNNGTALIKADSAIIDFGSGNVNLNNAQLIRQENGNIKVNADSFLYQDSDGTSLGFEAFQLQQNTINNISTVNLSASNMNFSSGQEIITADNMSFNLIDDKNNNSQLLEINANNVNYQSSNGNLTATSAIINYTSNPQGSSTSFTGQNINWISQNEQIKLDGNSNIVINQNSNGNLTSINVNADNLNYSNNTGTKLNAVNGSLNINYNDSGTYIRL
ncbi:MAG: hypothetical protein KatS3mg068_1954 [Candidatus Sericytochromatia bacterium]|nr:MAG: hypothetical protein KatS3mg068_1954 [Candidatus Sericytochromatia bacterium]